MAPMGSKSQLIIGQKSKKCTGGDGGVLSICDTFLGSKSQQKVEKVLDIIGSCREEKLTFERKRESEGLGGVLNNSEGRGSLAFVARFWIKITIDYRTKSSKKCWI